VPRLVFGVPTTGPSADFGDLLHDKQALPFEIDILPAQADGFAAAHAGDEHQLIEVGEAVVGDMLQEGVTLLRRPGPGPLGVLRCELDVLRRAVGKQAAFDRGVERRPENGMDPADRARAQP